MRFRELLVCTLLVVVHASTVLSQAPPVSTSLLELDGTQERPKLLGQEEAIHAEDDPAPSAETPFQRAMHLGSSIYGNSVAIQLSVVVNLNGRVESARPIDGPVRFYEQAMQIEMHREFAPVRDRHGTIVRAHFIDYVSIYPPERWSEHTVSFPQQVDLRSFRIELERTDCFGSCSSYKVAVLGSGQVIWEGNAFVAVPGKHRATITPEAVQRLVEEVRDSHILNALDAYEASWSDNPTYTLTLEVNGVHKRVMDYVGPVVGMPLSLRRLEAAVDREAGAKTWIEGGAALLPTLKAESWNFASRSRDNLELYNSMLERSNREVLAAYYSAHGPIYSIDAKTPSPVCIASGAKDSHTALELLSSIPKGTRLPQHTLNSCLVSAARAGNLDLVDLWLKNGAAVTPAPLTDPNNAGMSAEPMWPLTAAIQGGSTAVVQRLLEAHAPVQPEHNGGHNLLTLAAENSEHPAAEMQAIIEALIDAGADPNDETEQDKPALFAVDYQPQLISCLVRHGAQINGRDSMGNTPLISAFSTPTLNALLDAGADPTLRDKAGKTAGERFRAQGLTEQADLLAVAEAAWQTQHGQSQ